MGTRRAATKCRGDGGESILAQCSIRLLIRRSRHGAIGRFAQHGPSRVGANSGEVHQTVSSSRGSWSRNDGGRHERPSRPRRSRQRAAGCLTRSQPSAAGKRANETTAAADMKAISSHGATSEVVVLRHLGPVAKAAQRIQQSNLNGAPSRCFRSPFHSALILASRTMRPYFSCSLRRCAAKSAPHNPTG
jgi:hypothetical protein